MPRTFAPGEILTDDDFRKLVVSQGWFACDKDACELQDRYEHRPREPCRSMTRKQLFELIDQAGEDEDRERWLILAEHLRDQMTTAELARENTAMRHATEIITSRGRMTLQEHAQLLANSFDFVNLVEHCE